MSFKTFFFALDPTEQEAYAERVGSTVQMLRQIAYGYKAVELGFADALVAVSKAQVKLGDIRLTDRATHQLGLRNEGGKAAPGRTGKRQVRA